MKRVILEIGSWIVAGFVLLWLFCCSGCISQDLEGNTYAWLPFCDDGGDMYQVQLNHPTHYYLKGEKEWPK